MKTYQPPRGETGDPRMLDPDARPLPTKDGWICVSANTNEQAFAYFDAMIASGATLDGRISSNER